MKEYSIKGTLIVPDEYEHLEMVDKFYELLKEDNWFFRGETKEIKPKIYITDSE